MTAGILPFPPVVRLIKRETEMHTVAVVVAAVEEVPEVEEVAEVARKVMETGTLSMGPTLSGHVQSPFRRTNSSSPSS